MLWLVVILLLICFCLMMNRLHCFRQKQACVSTLMGFFLFLFFYFYLLFNVSFGAFYINFFIFDRSQRRVLYFVTSYFLYFRCAKLFIMTCCVVLSKLDIKATRGCLQWIQLSKKPTSCFVKAWRSFPAQIAHDWKSPEPVLRVIPF